MNNTAPITYSIPEKVLLDCNLYANDFRVYCLLRSYIPILESFEIPSNLICEKFEITEHLCIKSLEKLVSSAYVSERVKIVKKEDTS